MCDPKYFYGNYIIETQNLESEKTTDTLIIQNNNIELCTSGTEVTSKDKAITLKKIKNVDAWKRNVRKIKRNSGQAYITRTGHSFDKKQLQPPCTEQCKYKCTTNFTNNMREKLLESFRPMADVCKGLL